MMGHVLDSNGSARPRWATAAPVVIAPSTKIGAAGVGAAGLRAGAAARSRATMDGARTGASSRAAFAAGAPESARDASGAFCPSWRSAPARERFAGAGTAAGCRVSSVTWCKATVCGAVSGADSAI